MTLSKSDAVLPKGWMFVDVQRAEQLEAELRREIFPTHLLARKETHAIAECEFNDDALFQAANEPSVFFVHLTWRVETNSNWPHTTQFVDISNFNANWES